MTHVYQDPSRSIEERARDLLGRMTLEEKAAQMVAMDREVKGGIVFGDEDLEKHKERLEA